MGSLWSPFGPIYADVRNACLYWSEGYLWIPPWGVSASGVVHGNGEHGSESWAVVLCTVNGTLVQQLLLLCLKICHSSPVILSDPRDPFKLFLLRRLLYISRVFNCKGQQQRSLNCSWITDKPSACFECSFRAPWLSQPHLMHTQLKDWLQQFILLVLSHQHMFFSYIKLPHATSWTISLLSTPLERPEGSSTMGN